jgi:predicted AAA+ superfamily ATPase
MHPFSIKELNITEMSQMERLLQLGGFPEPYFSNDLIEAKRWRRERLRRVALEDIKDLEQIKDISSVEHLLTLLPRCVSSQLSYQSLANQIEVDPKTVQKWIGIFDNLYLTYRVFPYIPKKIRVVKKTPRLYFWDWGGLENRGAAFENFVASHLLKYCHFIEDTIGDEMQLCYLKDVEGREIDFVVLKNRKPLFAVECKAGDRAASPHLRYFKKVTSIPYFYQVHMGSKHVRLEDNIEIIPFLEFAKKLE